MKSDLLYGGFLSVGMFLLVTTILTLFLPDDTLEGLVTTFLVASVFLLIVSSLLGLGVAVWRRVADWRIRVLAIYSGLLPVYGWVHVTYEPFSDIVLASAIGGYFLINFSVTLWWFFHSRRRIAG